MGVDFNERVIRNTLLDENMRRFVSEQHWNYPTKGHRAKADEENQMWGRSESPLKTKLKIKSLYCKTVHAAPL